MENMIDQDQQWLINSLNATLDTNQQARSFAEASLNQASVQPGMFIIHLCKLFDISGYVHLITSAIILFSTVQLFGLKVHRALLVFNCRIVVIRRRILDY